MLYNLYKNMGVYLHNIPLGLKSGGILYIPLHTLWDLGPCFCEIGVRQGLTFFKIFSKTTARICVFSG